MNIPVGHAATSEFCDGYALEKAHRETFKSRSCRATLTGEIIHADLNGPMSASFFSGGAR